MYTICTLRPQNQTLSFVLFSVAVTLRVINGFPLSSSHIQYGGSIVTKGIRLINEKYMLWPGVVSRISTPYQEGNVSIGACYVFTCLIESDFGISHFCAIHQD